MIKQRICIVGDGLSGLMTAVILSKVSGVEVNLIAKKGIKYADKRTTAISDTNYKFINQNIKETIYGNRTLIKFKGIEFR